MYDFGKKKNNKLMAAIVILIVAAMLITTILVIHLEKQRDYDKMGACKEEILK